MNIFRILIKFLKIKGKFWILKIHFFLFFSAEKSLGQIFAFKQSVHFGFLAEQMVCPNPTRSQLISDHSSSGSQLSSCIRVSSGFFGFLVHLRRCKIRCIWTSTPIPSFLPNAHWRAKYPIFGPIPGRATSVSMVSGMSPPYCSSQIFPTFMMFLAFVFLKPTGWIKSASSENSFWEYSTGQIMNLI